MALRKSPWNCMDSCLHVTTYLDYITPNDARWWPEIGDMPWQESHGIEHKPCELLVLFLSCRILYPRDQGWTINPDQDRLFQNLTISPWHHSQVRRYHHPMTAHIFNKSSHIIPQGPHHHQELFRSSSRGLQWDFCWNPLRSFQDLGFKNSFEPRLVHL